MRKCCWFISLLLFSAGSAWAGPRTTFPYTTTVVADEVEVRSGPGTRYYATSRLRRGQRVEVHRHDPGGWQMIAPPPGSFSWIRADEVRQISADAGVVAAREADVRVGGPQARQWDVFQARLADGDEVRILGEEEFPAEPGGATLRWFRISPPRGEWRWIPAQTLAPTGGLGNRRSIIPAGGFADDEGPSATGGVNVPDEPGFNSGATSVPPARGTPNFADDETHAAAAPHPSAPAAVAAPAEERPYLDPETDVLRGTANREKRPRRRSGVPTRDDVFDAQLAELEQLDEQLRALADREPLTWDLAGLDRGYRELLATVESGPLAETIDTRLRRIAYLSRVQGHRAQVRRIMLETERRDAQLVAARQMGIRPDSILTPATVGVLSESGRSAFRGAEGPGGPATMPSAARVAPRDPFDGAGIIERSSRRGTPAYALLAPNGRLLAYLAVPQGVDIEAWRQREAGVVGRRQFDPRLGADVIEVTGLSSVRLLR